MSTIVVVIFFVLVFCVPLLVFMIAQNYGEPDPRSIREQLLDLLTTGAVSVGIDISLNMAFYGRTYAKWQRLPFATAYLGGSLTKIAALAIIRSRKSKA